MRHAAWLIKANGERKEIAPKNGTDFTADELHGYVGGYIEIVRFRNEIMVVNEEGKLYGLPYNHNATILARWKGYDDDIVGDVVVCHKKMVL